MGTASTETPRKIAVTSVKVEQTKLDQLREVATREHRSVSQQIRFLIDQCIAEKAT